MNFKVLLVDDDAPLRDCLQRWLTQDQAEVIAVENGREAIERLCHDRDSFAVVVSDVEMPCVDGWELLAWVQKHHSQLPVVLVSASQPRQFIDRARKVGAYGALPKPFEMRSLSNLVTRLMRFANQTGKQGFYCPSTAMS